MYGGRERERKRFIGVLLLRYFVTFECLQWTELWRKKRLLFFQCCKHVTKVWNGAFSRQSEMSRLFKYVHCSIHFVLWSLAFHAFVHNEEKKVIHNERQVRNVVPLKQLKRISYLMCVDALEFCWDFFFISFLELWK